jgi:hypothetical protein
VLLSNTLRALNLELDTTPVGWADEADIADWALEHTNIVFNAGLMGGTHPDMPRFSPGGMYTREQTVITIMKLHEYSLEHGGYLWSE